VDTGRVSEEEVLLTHSEMSKSEEELERLLGIESIQNPVRVVVNVMELTEGWDVANVYVVTPLRAMATFQGALQAMGRGLRLPAGRRLGNPVLDELDVVCFGREKLERIVSEAVGWTGTNTVEAGGLKVTPSDQADPELVPVAVKSIGDPKFRCADLRIARRELDLVLSPEALRSVSAAIVTEVRLAAASTRLGGRAKVARDRFTRAAALRCIRALPQFLSDEKHAKDIEQIIETWMSDVRPGTGPVDFDPAEVGEEIAAALRRNAKMAAPEYQQVADEKVIQFPAYVGREEVMLAPGAPPPSKAVADMQFYKKDFFKKGQLYQGWSDSDGKPYRWTRAGHEAYAFDAEPEAMAAVLLDRAEEVEWWVRNAPVRFEIETPAGGQYRPDFVVKVRSEKAPSYLLLEPKADIRWSDPQSEERLKNRAALEWAERQRALGHQIDVGVALETDIKRSASWAELFVRLQPKKA